MPPGCWKIYLSNKDIYLRDRLFEKFTFLHCFLPFSFQYFFALSFHLSFTAFLPILFLFPFAFQFLLWAILSFFSFFLLSFPCSLLLIQFQISVWLPYSQNSLKCTFSNTAYSKILLGCQKNSCNLSPVKICWPSTRSEEEALKGQLYFIQISVA